jgi:serine/threonine-protein kinase
MALPESIALDEEFRYVHEPMVGDAGPIRFLGESVVIEGLRDRIRHSDGGSFLVTGFRGAGKTTAVLRTLDVVEALEPDTLDYLAVVLNVARPVTLDQLLFEVVRRLFEALIDTKILEDLSPDVRRALVLAYARTSLSFKETRSEAIERAQTLGLGAGGSPAPIIGALKPTLGFSRKRTDSMAMEASFLAYSHGDVEHDFIRILDLLNRPQAPPSGRWRRMLWRLRGARRKPWRGRVVVVLDELDKLSGSDEGWRTVGELLTGLKNILTTRDAHFIFVGGPELHDAAILDAARGNSVYESVFAHEAYVPCLWGAGDDLLEQVLAPGAVDEDDRTVLRDYLDYKSRGIPRLLLRELNDLVRWSDEQPRLWIDAATASRIAFYADLQRVLREFIERSEEEEMFTLPIDVDRWRLGTYYLTDSILRHRRGDFSTSEIVGHVDGGTGGWFSAVSAERVERLVDHLVASGIVRVTWDPSTGTLIEDARQERRYELEPRVRRQLSSLIRDDARIRAELSDDGRIPEGADVAQDFGTVHGGRYVLRDIVGRGGTGTVYRADDALLRRQVAIKLLEAEALRSDDRMRSRFRREAEVASRLEHAGIVSTHEIFEEDDGRLGIVMEMVEGTNLRELIPLPVTEAVEIALVLLDALDYLQSAGMARIDLKPDNVIVRDRTRPIIVDLGLVKSTDASATGFDTREHLPAGTTGPMIGTPSYMSPEQVRGEPVDIRSDIHALGLLLFEMIAGDRAYDAETMVRVLYQIIQEDVDVGRLDVSPELRAVVSRATEREADERYQSPADMRAALLACPEATGTSLTDDAQAPPDRALPPSDRAGAGR